MKAGLLHTVNWEIFLLQNSHMKNFWFNNFCRIKSPAKAYVISHSQGEYS